MFNADVMAVKFMNGSDSGAARRGGHSLHTLVERRRAAISPEQYKTQDPSEQEALQTSKQKLSDDVCHSYRHKKFRYQRGQSVEVEGDSENVKHVEAVAEVAGKSVKRGRPRGRPPKHRATAAGQGE